MPSVLANSVQSMDVDKSGGSKKRSRQDDSLAEDREDKKLKLGGAESSKQTRERKHKKKRAKKRKASVTGIDKAAAVRSSREPNDGGDALDDAVPELPDSLDGTPRALELFPRAKTADFVEGSSSSSSRRSPSIVAESSGKSAPSTSTAVQVNEVSSTSPDKSAQLEIDLATTAKSLTAHESLLTALLPSLTCQICLDLLHKPFALSPCGHSACYDCLVRWFTSEPAEGQAPPALYRKKTCPHCRASVRERPVEVWAIKDMVSAFIKSGLATAFPPPPPPSEPATPARDPWANIFHQHPARPTHGMEAALDALGEGGAGNAAALGMHDREDGVWRCLDCMHEIWGAECSACGRQYPGHMELGVDDWSDGEDYVPGPDFIADMLRGGLLPPDVEWDDVEEEEDELDVDADHGGGSEDEESYEGSFIDDGEAEDRASHHRGEVVDVSSDSEEEVRRVPRPDGRTRIAVRIDSDDEDTAAGPSNGRRTNHGGGGGRMNGRRVIDSDEEAENDELQSDDSIGIGRHSEDRSDYGDDGSIARPPIHLAHLFGHRPSLEGDSMSEHSGNEDERVGVVFTDEEGCDDDGRVAYSPRHEYALDEEDEDRGWGSDRGDSDWP